MDLFNLIARTIIVVPLVIIVFNTIRNKNNIGKVIWEYSFYNNWIMYGICIIPLVPIYFETIAMLSGQVNTNNIVSLAAFIVCLISVFLYAKTKIQIRENGISLRLSAIRWEQINSCNIYDNKLLINYSDNKKMSRASLSYKDIDEFLKRIKQKGIEVTKV